jgi:hypothetical protein
MASNQVTMNWVKLPNTGFNQAGFTNVELATISGFTNGLTGVHTVGITNADFGLSYMWDFTANARAGDLAHPTNSIAIKHDLFGKVTVTFGNGNKRLTTIGYAGVLEDAQSADGYFLQTFPTPVPTDSGIITIR